MFTPAPRLRPLPPPELRQTASPLRAYLMAGEALRVTPVIGTDGFDDEWAMDPVSLLARTLAGQGVYFIRGRDGRPFRWYAGLDGLKKDKHLVWDVGADAIYYWADPLPYAERNFIAYSHGGQPIWILAASGFKIRSVTFVGTPNRNDVGSAQGIENIGMAQVIFDDQWDWMGWLGAVFDGQVSTDRSFKQLGPRMKRSPKRGIGHGGVLKNPTWIQLWNTEAWIPNMRDSAPEAA